MEQELFDLLVNMPGLLKDENVDFYGKAVDKCFYKQLSPLQE